MSGMVKVALAAALLNCGTIQASAEQSGRWLTDPISGCAVFDAEATADASVRWTGACANGYADGVGTATFGRDVVPHSRITARPASSRSRTSSGRSPRARSAIRLAAELITGFSTLRILF